MEKTGISRVTCSSLWNGRVERPTQKPLHLEKGTDPLPVGPYKQRPVRCVSGPTPSLPALPSAGHIVHRGLCGTAREEVAVGLPCPGTRAG